MCAAGPDVVLLCLRGRDIGQVNAGRSALIGNSLAFSCCKSHSERVESTPGTAAIYLPGGGLLLWRFCQTWWNLTDFYIW